MSSLSGGLLRAGNFYMEENKRGEIFCPCAVKEISGIRDFVCRFFISCCQKLIDMTNEELMRKAIELSRKNVAEGGGPFGAVIACNGEIVATGVNRVTDSCDPTAHAEVSAMLSGRLPVNWVHST